MDYAKRVEEVKGSADLVGKLTSTRLRNLETPLVEVIKKVTTTKVLKNNEELLVVLKDVQKSDYIGVLSNLQDLNLTHLHFHFFQLEFLFGYTFDGYLSPSALVN